MTSLRWTAPAGGPATTADARVELAALCRLVAREGFAPIGGARLAVRDPQATGAYVANPGGILLEEVRASTLLRVDRDGVRLDTGEPEPDAGSLALVLAALEAKPEAVAAAQVASTAGTVVAGLRDGLLPMTQTSFMFHRRIGRHDWEPTVPVETLRRRVASDLGDGRAIALLHRPSTLRGRLAELPRSARSRGSLVSGMSGHRRVRPPGRVTPSARGADVAGREAGRRTPGDQDRGPQPAWVQLTRGQVDGCQRARVRGSR